MSSHPGAPASAVLDAATFDHIRQVVHQQSGISLKGDKMTLVTARLTRRLRDLGLDSYRAYVQHLQADTTGTELTILLDAIATNVTYFFREEDHFTFLRRQLVAWQQAGRRRFRIWSAACSTGEEPYSLAMALDEVLASDTDLRILATDISTQALTRASEGVYGERALESIPAELRSRHLVRRHGAGAATFEIAAATRKRILFRHLNLISLPLPMRGPLDIILCRNVMIYFDNPTRSALVGEFQRLLRPGGFLLVSHTESLIGLSTELRLTDPSIYQRPEPEPAP